MYKCVKYYVMLNYKIKINFLYQTERKRKEYVFYYNIYIYFINIKDVNPQVVIEFNLIKRNKL